MGQSDFTKIPNGIPSLEERINLLYTCGVRAGRIDLHTLVNVASTQVAKTFDLFPRKGTIQPGADADLVVFDPDYRGVISAKTQHMNVDYSAFEGWKIEGRPSVVTVRGAGRRARRQLRRATPPGAASYGAPRPAADGGQGALGGVLAGGDHDVAAARAQLEDGARRR